jgi:DNA-3-methyladenine glycosylase II
MDQSFPPITLNQESLLEGISYLAKADTDLAEVISDLGAPPLWAREPCFPTLIHIILEQQVSLASAKAAFSKLNESVGWLTPERFLAFTDGELRDIGFSKQKTSYGRELSMAILRGELDLGELNSLDDTSARSELMKIKGIGPWTADIYLLMALLRPDIWPSGDLALAKAAQAIKKLPSLPAPEILAEIAVNWKPWRAVAARVLWHYYLN